MSPRVCLIGFDSPDRGLLEAALEHGRLPNLERIANEGAFVDLRQHQELTTSASHVSMVTAATITEHGSGDSLRLVPGSYRVEPAGFSACSRPPYWSHIGAAGLRSTVVSVYGAGLVPGLPGKQVVGWGSHDPYARDNWASEPPSLVRELERDFGPRLLRYATLHPGNHDEALGYLARVIEGIERHGRALAALAARDDWEFFAGSFADGHQAGHYLYHHALPDHPRHDPHAPSELRDGLARIYAKTDEAIGRVAESLPDDVTLLLSSPYTLQPNHMLWEALVPLFEARGLLRRQAGAAGRPVIRDPRLRALGAARGVARALLPQRARWELSKRIPRDRMIGALTLADVDWSQTRAFPIPSDGSAYVRLNVVGREPRGIVEPGPGYDAICAEVAGEILALRDSAGPVAAEVRRLDELYPVEERGSLPDLVVRWRRGTPDPELRAAGGELVPLRSRDMRPAIHAEPGFLSGAGPGIPASGHGRLEGPAAKLIDIGPTVLALLGVPQPPELSGSPVPAFAGAEHAQAERRS